MFSEYASRFLAQSQSRLLSSQTDQRAPGDRPGRPASRTSSSRQFSQRQLFSNNPYTSSTTTQPRFSFASRLTPGGNPPAPLFHSTTDEFREEEEDDAAEHEREVADFYALQRSRRDFAASRMTDSTGSVPDDDSRDGDNDNNNDQDNDPSPQRRQQPSSSRTAHPTAPARGIRSSWTADDPRSGDQQSDNTKNHGKRRPFADTLASFSSSFTGGHRDNKLVDVQLASTIHEDDEPFDHPGASQSRDPNDAPPSIQTFQRAPPASNLPPFRDSTFLQHMPPDPEAAHHHVRISSPITESVAQVVPSPAPEPPMHDVFWATLFLISMATLFATFVLVVLHTSLPQSRLGDTVYTTMHASFYLLAVDSLVAVVVALLWLATLRSFVRPLVYGILVSVPIIAFSFSLYPFVSSFQGQYKGHSVQDKVMRWLSFVPLIFAVLWTYTAYKSRRSLGRAIELLEFASKILAANPALILIGFATLAAVVTWTWIWMLMFTRVFLGGHLSTSRTPRFIIDGSTWWLGIFFILVYLWTLGVIAGVQRTTTAATVSQWYFHRLVVPAPSSQRVVRASVEHSVTTIFGTTCFSTLLSLAVRLPLLVLPRRFSGYLAMAFYSFIPASITTLTNPLTLTYAAIHSQPLTISARGLSDMTFISSHSPTSTLTPGDASRSQKPIYAYRLSKLLLHATRFITCLAFGFGGWVSTARMLKINESGGNTIRGSLYAYVVGLVAGAIGWAVLGAMEGVLGGILDAVVVCWGSEVGQGGDTGARYCREADALLGGGDGAAADDDDDPLTQRLNLR